MKKVHLADSIFARRSGQTGSEMYINLAGEWNLSLNGRDGEPTGRITLPGILQAQGFGSPIDRQTPWVSGLHDDFWYEQEEFQFAQEEQVNVPFLSQPPRHFLGEAWYRREITLEESEEDWYFYAELTKWKSRVFVDGVERGSQLSLCAPHEICLGKLTAGTHSLLVCIDNSMQLPYRPDAHGVSDALGATWNGMVGELALYSSSQRRIRRESARRYAEDHPRTVEIRDGNFVIDGSPVYFRATHFGGDFPLTGYPETDIAWWRSKMQTMKRFGLNGMRCHSFCPPEAAFAAADIENIYLLVECGMWNRFDEGEQGRVMRQTLREESRRILDAFGHHPSFVFFSPSNEPSGKWYQPLREWVQETRKYDEEKGYAGRRAYTAQSGWMYDVEPAEITGTDFIYFHRSGYGPLFGGTIRNSEGWKGRDYGSSLKDCRLPVVSHELGQWCSYPDFSVIDKFTGYLQPGNYRIFRESARAAGLLDKMDELHRCSVENQMRLYKEDLEATFRTPQIKGFELLDLHDYLGQGSALVGLLDAFWDEKKGVTAEAFRQFCGETVLLARCESYVYGVRPGDTLTIPLETSHYGRNTLTDGKAKWRLLDGDCCLCEGSLSAESILPGGNTVLGEMKLSFERLSRNIIAVLEVCLTAGGLEGEVKNTWPIHLFVEQEECPQEVICTRNWKEARAALEKGARVVYSPWLTELNYECPSLAMKNVFWNSQLGPTWSRPLGLVVEKHPLFQEFPSEPSGGWQWEDILSHGRGFHMKNLEGAEVLVRAIDDWNRSLSLGLIWEAKVGRGSLLVVSADLEGSFAERPAAHALKSAILHYAASERFQPSGEVAAEAVEEKLFSVFRMWELSESVVFDDTAMVLDGEALVQPNPNSYARVEKQDFPVNILFKLKKQVEAEGLLYVPVQRDRAHEGFVKEYQVSCRNRETGEWEVAAQGVLPNSCFSENISFEKKFFTDEIRLTVLSAYGCVRKQIWQNRAAGWEKVWKEKSAVVQAACLQVICEGEAECSNQIFWEKDQKTNTKEIEA